MPQFRTRAAGDANQELWERRYVSVNAPYVKQLSARAERRHARVEIEQQLLDVDDDMELMDEDDLWSREWDDPVDRDLRERHLDEMIRRQDEEMVRVLSGLS